MTDQLVPTLNFFSPSEAEEMSFVSPTLARDWRRKGFLPKSEGRARYDVHSIAEIYAMKRMSDKNIFPKLLPKVIDLLGKAIAYRVMGYASAYGGIGPFESIDEDGLTGVTFIKPEIIKNLRSLICADLDHADLEKNYLLIAQNGSKPILPDDVRFTDSLGSRMELKAHQEPVTQWIVLSIRTCANELIHRAPRPFATVRGLDEN